MPRILGRAALDAQRQLNQEVEMAETEEQVEESQEAAEALEKAQNLDPEDFKEPGDQDPKKNATESLTCEECGYVAPDKAALEKHVAKHKGE